MPEPIKPEAILTYLGFKPEEIKTEEDFKAQFEPKFAIKDQLINDKDFVGKIFGKRVGSIDTAAKSGFKKMGVEFSKEEIDGKQVEDIFVIGFNKLADLNKKVVEDVEKSAKGTVDEQVKEWKEKYNSVSSELKDTKNLLGKTKEEFEGFQKNIQSQFKSEKINNYKKEIISKLEFKQDINPVERIGFETLIDAKYDFDLDENQTPFIKDKKTGERLKSKKTIGEFMKADEILNEELIANKLAKINKDGGKPAPKYGQPATTSAEPTTKTLFIHASARKAAGM